MASKDRQEIYSVDSVPKGFVLSDPDHLQASEIDPLYKHWLARQKKKLPPFVVVKSHPQHPVSEKKSKMSEKAKGKQKIRYTEVNSDDPSVKGSDQELDNLSERELGTEDEGDSGADELEQQEDYDNDNDNDDNDDKDNDDEDEDDDLLPPAVKYGPPIGKGKKTAASTPVAGPSKLPPPKQLLKKSQSGKGASKKMTNPSSSSRTQVEKRKKEEVVGKVYIRQRTVWLKLISILLFRRRSRRRKRSRGGWTRTRRSRLRKLSQLGPPEGQPRETC